MDDAAATRYKRQGVKKIEYGSKYVAPNNTWHVSSSHHYVIALNRFYRFLSEKYRK